MSNNCESCKYVKIHRLYQSEVMRGTFFLLKTNFFLSFPFLVGQYQKCMALSDCEMLKSNAYIEMKCCSEDMCNTF